MSSVIRFWFFKYALANQVNTVIAIVATILSTPVNVPCDISKKKLPIILDLESLKCPVLLFLVVVQVL
jgi:hypothetical protein